MASRLHYLKQLIAMTRRVSMLRVEYHDIGETVSMRLEGRLLGEFANDARDLVTRCRTLLRRVVNSSEVTCVDGFVLLWSSANWRGACCRELLSPPRLRTPASADGAEERRGSPPRAM